MPRKRPVKPPGMSKYKRVTHVLPYPWLDMADQMATILGISRSKYMTNALQRQMMEDWTASPARGLIVMPGTQVLRRVGDRYIPLATARGGERFFSECNVGRLPATLGGGIGLRGHVVPIGMKDGLSAEGVIVDRASLGPLKGRV